MAINTLEMAKLFQQSLDKQMLVGATSGWMEANATQVKYNGGDTVRMPEISTSGLANYDRDNGFNQGAVTLKYEDYKLTQDRGRTFHLDAMDVDESNFIAAAGNVMGEFQRVQVVPEVDAYRYSKIAELAKKVNHTTEAEPAKTTILEMLDDEITKIQDVIGENSGLVIVMSTPVRTILNNAKDIQKYFERSHREDGKIPYGRKVFTSEKELIKQVEKHEARYNNTAKTTLDFKSPNQVVSEYFSMCNICVDK